MTTRVSVNLNFPVEWWELFNQLDLDDVDEDLISDTFAGSEWEEWVRDNPHLRYVCRESSDHFNTEEHSTPNHQGQRLVCYTYRFEMDVDTPQSSRHPVRRELRISVPPPTKLPLPR